MKVFFWVPPWPVNGDPNFFRNCFVKHLCPQANSLVGFAKKVSVAIPAHFAPFAASLDSAIDVVVLPLEMTRTAPPLSSNVYEALYAAPDGSEAGHLITSLRSQLPKQADVILLWESPVPFFEQLYPEALIIHQMPGTFSRPPYPHTVTFDPIGLYRQGSLHLHAGQFQTGVPSDLPLAHDFIDRTQRAMHGFGRVTQDVMQQVDGFDGLALLPLQASKHYAFAPDSGFTNQMDMLLSVLDKLDPKTALLATQYRNGLVADTPLDDAVAASIKERHNNFIYDPKLETIESVSQYFLPHVDQVISASSSLGLQGMAWEKALSVVGDTFLQRYDARHPVADGLSWQNRCENTIGTVLSRHQPLADSVTKDGTFLHNLLEEMLQRKRDGADGLDVLPAFRDIDPDYDDKLLSGFRIARSAKSLSMSAGKDCEAETLLKLQNLIDKQPTKAFSFDVFDTLIRRSVEKPADLYRFLDLPALELTNGIAADFGRVRSMCEVETRRRLEGAKEEISLEDIYETIASYYGMPLTDLRDLMTAEIELEVEHSRARPFGKVMFDYLRAQGRPIYLISDMYHDAKVIARMLQKAGYGAVYSDLFVSSNYGCTKHSGKLYQVVLDELGLAPQDLVHIGDNKRTDIERAEAQNIRAFRWSSSIDWMRSNRTFKDVYNPRKGAGEKARSAVAGTISAGLFDGPLAKGHYGSLSGADPFRLGYAVLGPLLTGYMTWLRREVARDGISDLYFMAREGWILKNVFDCLPPLGASPPKTHYLLGSRRAIRVATCRSSADVMALLAMPYDPGVPLDRLIEGRFGLRITAGERLQKLGIKRADIQLERSYEMRQLLCAVVQAFLPEILANADVERGAYMSYLKGECFMQATRAAVVDVGWKTNIQGALGDLTGKRSTGYYYATLQDSELWIAKGDRHRAYAGTSLSGPLASSIAVQNRHMVEFLLCGATRSLVSMAGTDGAAIYRPESDAPKRQALINALHRGAIKYARDFADGFEGLIDQLYIDPQLAEATLTSFLTRPQKADAEMFVGQSFEDAVGGIAQKFVVSPDRKASASTSVWRHGASAVYDGTKVQASRLPVADGSPNTDNPALEKLFVSRFLSDRKQAKYQRDRALFFEDTSSPIARLYWNTLGNRPE